MGERGKPKRVKSFRMEAELEEWAEVYAARRGSSFSAVLNAAVREFRVLAERGVPVLPSAPVGKLRGAAPVSSPRVVPASVSVPPAPAVRQGLPVKSNRTVGAGAEALREVLGENRRPLVEVVAERLGANELRAVRHIQLGNVKVGGESCRDPGLLVDPSAVRV
jgi:hypothetical protein